MNTLHKYKIIACVSSWGALGFKRGIDSYAYDINRNTYKKGSPFLYSRQLIEGILGTFIYINPFLFPITMANEIYRFEVWARNMEHEKNSDRYHRLM